MGDNRISTTTNYARHFAQKGPTPQSEPIPGREKDMAKNDACGFAFQIDDWARLDRFLILGSEGGTYYVGEHKLTVDNAQCVLRCIKEDGLRTVGRIFSISEEGRAPKNDPALFALALCASAEDVATRKAALAVLPKVARTGTHLFTFIAAVTQQRGWGRALKRAVANWYIGKTAKSVAIQLLKYPQRGGMSHRDLLRLSHPVLQSEQGRAVIAYGAGHPVVLDLDDRVRRIDIAKVVPSVKLADGKLKDAVHDTQQFVPLHPMLDAYEDLKANTTAENAVRLIKQEGLTREAIPTDLLNDKQVWSALLDDMPMTAMIRNLGKMSSIELLKPMAKENRLVLDALSSAKAIREARVHPMQILLALRTYANGHGEKGKLTWQPVPQIMDALDSAFYLAFKNVEPTNKRIMYALDVSGSMGGSMIAGSSLSAREAAAAMAMIGMATEQNYCVVGFTASATRTGGYGVYGRYGSITALNMTAKMRLNDATNYIAGLSFGNTYCALPMLYAQKHTLPIDAFVILTDNETWAGSVHPMQALNDYRKKSGIAAKLVVVGMTSTGFSIADPKDMSTMDVVGFDASAPAIISDFIRK